MTETIDRETVKQNLGACGLSCAKCMAYVHGDIGRHAAELQRLLGDFDRYAKRFSAFKPVFNNYPAFKEMLAFFATPGCRGCRQGDCLYPNCVTTTCHKEKGVDFCAECPEFPCDRVNFDPDLRKRWIQMNERMKEVGPEGYFAETKDASRYR